tara:strand:- start:1038 stop:1829 length:792 start_codon:yes stop_codon:yes gene_type:complete
MWKAFLEVIHDLSLFATGREVDEIAPPTTQKQNLNKLTSSATRQTPVTHLYGAAYVITREEFLLLEPALSIDGRVTVLHYGDQVAVNRLQGDYAEVVFAGRQGWVRRDSLSDDPALVFPQFEPGYVYHSRHEDTIKLRKYLNDETLSGRLDLPVQPVEHIVYMTKRKKMPFTWPHDRPRTPGQLNALLRGRPGVHTAIEPRTDAVIESTDPDGLAFMGCVEAVHPDNSIVVSSFGRVTEGEYRSETFTQSEWKEWRPVFLTFT